MERRERGLWPLAGLAILALLCIPALAFAWIDGVTVDPPNPGPGDVVTITVHGYFLDGCWAEEGEIDCPDALTSWTEIDVYWVDWWEPGVPCPAVEFDYHYDCVWQPEHAEGGYTVVVTEHHDSLRYPDPDIEVIEFVVGDPTGLPLDPTGDVHDTWSTVKSRY